ncbi:class I glutamine amidotransferase-like protein [Coniochaeta sp. 2T2.1]|nr:class I glutamine amidotransferase-like protein [Coniochaeta sp. 2T2.1]
MTQSRLPPQAPALRIAVLLNSYKSPFIAQLRQSYVRTIGAVSPRSRLTFFYPAEKDEFPNPADFDLIVLGGSNVDPRKNHEWIKRVHQFVLKVIRDFPDKKLCGICWGHQTISRIFGGELVDMDYPEIGVTEVKLTAEGQRFFSSGGKGRTKFLRLQQHHRREVSKMPAGFISLSEDNQCFINERRTILTLQGHPEKDAETAKLRIHDIERWFQLNIRDQTVVAEVMSRMELEDDGAIVWKRILEWAAETEPLDGQLAARMA